MQLAGPAALAFSLSLSLVGCDEDGSNDDGDDAAEDGGGDGGEAGGDGGEAGGDGGEAGDDGGTGDREGYTECGNNPATGPQYCAAGQYCADPTFFDCQTGCIGEQNCTASQVCVKESGNDIGLCQEPAEEVSCEQVCEKLMACAGATQEQCDMFCAGANNECKECIVNANCGDSCDAECGF